MDRNRKPQRDQDQLPWPDGVPAATRKRDRQTVPPADVAQPAFEGHIRENLDAKAVELLDLMKTEVGAANQAVYLD